MQGTLKRLGDSFGFFDTSDGDVYVRRSDLPNDARDGDRFELDAEDRGGRNPVATNIRFISHGAAPPARRDNARDRDRPDRDERNRRPLRVTWPETIKPRLGIYNDGAGDVTLLELPFSVIIRERDKQPKVGCKVTLKAERARQVDPQEALVTEDNGQVHYTVVLPQDAKHCDMSLSIWEGNRVVAVSSWTWEKPTEEPRQVRHIKTQKVGNDETWTTIRVFTLTSDKADAERLEADVERLEADVLAECGNEIEVEDAGAASHSVEVKIDDGSKLLRIKLAKAGKANVSFRLKDDPGVESDPIEIETVTPKTCKRIKTQKLGPDGTWTTIRVFTLTSDKADAERLEADVLAECGNEIEVEDAGAASHSVEVKIDDGSKLLRIKLAKAGKANVSFRLKDDPGVESDPIEIETKAQATCKRIKARVIPGRPGHSNTLEIETLADVSDNAPKLDDEVVVEFADELVLETLGVTQRGRQIGFYTGATGIRVVRVFFVAPLRFGHITLYSVRDRSVRTEVFVRHPATVAKP